MFLLLCLIGSVLGVEVTTLTNKPLTAVSINPGLSTNPFFPPTNGFGYTIDQNYWVAWSGTGCVANDPFSCVNEAYSQQIVSDPVTSNNKKLSDAGPSESVLYASQSPAGQFIVYLQQAPNKTFPSVSPVSGWSRKVDASGTGPVKLTPPVTIGLTGMGNSFFPDENSVQGHVTGWSTNIDDKLALLWATGPGTNTSNQNEIWLTKLNGDASPNGPDPWFKISPDVTQTKKDAAILSNCQNRLIFSATPTSGTNLYISNWADSVPTAQSLQGNNQNLNSTGQNQEVWWSSNGNSFALLWQTQGDSGVDPVVPPRWGLYFGNAADSTLFKSGARIGASQNDTFGAYTGYGWTSNGKYFLFTQQDSDNNGIADLWAYDPQNDVLVKITSLAKNNAISSVKGTGDYVVFSTTGDGDQNLAQLWSWQIAATPSPATPTNISPSGVVKNAFSVGGNSIGTFHITSDNSRVVVVAYTTQNFTANLFSCSINTASSCFQMNTLHVAKDGSSISESQMSISVVLKGNTDWFVFRYRMGFIGASTVNQYMVQSCSAASGSVPSNMHANPQTTALAAQSEYGASTPLYSPTNILLRQNPWACAEATLAKIGFTSCGGTIGQGCVPVYSGQAYVYSAVDTTSSDTTSNGANRLYVNTVDNSLGVKSLSEQDAAPAAEVPETVSARVHPTQPYVAWRAAKVKADGAGTVTQHQLFFSQIPGFKSGIALGPTLNGTLQDMEDSITFTNSATQKAVIFLQETNGTCAQCVYFARRMYFATFNSETQRTLFDATPDVLETVVGPTTDPLFGIEISTIPSGDILYFKSRLPNNAATSRQAVVGITPNGGVYTVAFDQSANIISYAPLEKKYQAIAVANYTGNAEQYNAYVNKAWSATIAPLFVLVALFLALF